MNQNHIQTPWPAPIGGHQAMVANAATSSNTHGDR
jgi:hypothetical protein